MKPVAKRRIRIAREHGIRNADIAARACREAGLPFYVACALLEKESHGQNIYGHDAGGALAGYPGPVTESSYDVFEWLVKNTAYNSNGVGPCQITWFPYFARMKNEGLKPWDVHDNMLFGFRLLKGHLDAAKGNYVAAGRSYNGATSYGIDLSHRVQKWKRLFAAR